MREMVAILTKYGRMKRLRKKTAGAAEEEQVDAFLTFDIVQSGLVILLLLVLGEWLSDKMKGAVPSILVAGILYMICCWCGVLPVGLPDTAGLATLCPVAIMLMITSMGASMSLSEFAANWRVVALSAISFCMQVAVLFLVIGSLFGLNTAVGALPGGAAVALIVQEKARQLGHDQLIVLSVLLLSVQALVASPVAVWGVRREARTLLSHDCELHEMEVPAAQKQRRSAPDSQFMLLCKLYAAAWLAGRIEMTTGISRYILCLLLGVALGAIGFLGKNSLAGTKSEGFILFLMFSMVLSGFSSATPEMFLQMLPVLLAVLACEIGSIALLAPLVGKLLGFSRPMSIALGINIMIGFPLNLMLSREVAGYVTDDAEQQTYIGETIGSKMVIAGLTSTTFLAVVAAGLLSPLMR